MIAFGMGNTLLTFVDKYYEYDGERNIRDKGLTIGGYESAWLADLVAAFILENTTNLLTRPHAMESTETMGWSSWMESNPTMTSASG
jgi:hypothetical protein